MEESGSTRKRAAIAASGVILFTVVAEIPVRLVPDVFGLDFIVSRSLYPAAIAVVLAASLAFLRFRSDSLWRAPLTLGVFFFSLYVADIYRLWIPTESILAALPRVFSEAESPAPWLIARSFIYVSIAILLPVFWYIDRTIAVTRPRLGRLRSEITIGRWKANWLVLLPFATIIALACGMAISIYLRDRPQMFLELFPDILPSQALGALNNALAEEIVFRAILLESFRRAVGDRWGNLLQTVVFTGGHVYWGPLGMIACGLSAYFLWGKSALATRGILWAVITHAAAVLGLVMFVGQ